MTIEERLYSKTKAAKKFGIIRALDEEGMYACISYIQFCIFNVSFSAEKMAKAREETLARDLKRDLERQKAKSATTSLW